MNIQEIQQAVGANPALLNEIAQQIVIPALGQNDDLVKAAVPVLGQKGYKVRSEADERSFLESYKTQVIESEIPTRIKEVHEKYDNDLFELTGERKGNHEKTYDFLKRKISEIKTAQVADPVIKEQLKTLQTQLEQKQNEFKKELEATEQKYFKRELDMSISATLDNVNIALPVHLKTDEEKQRYATSQKTMMKRDMLESLSVKKDNEGNIVFYDKDKPLTSTENGKPLQPSDIIKDRYGFYIAKEDSQQRRGTGTGGDGGSKKAFANKEAVNAHLAASGLAFGTTEYYAQYEKLCKESGLL